jgi:hypothetical protein
MESGSKEFTPEKYKKLCAEFLEWKEDFAHEADKYGYIQTIDGYMTPFINVDIIHSNISEYNRSENVHSIAQLKFDSDWNWIMKVVKKVNSINVYENNPSDTTLAIIREEMRTFLGFCNKEAVVQAIWEFLNRYKEKRRVTNNKLSYLL